MGIRFLCPNGHKLNVKAELAGKRGSCPECGAKILIPAASPSLETTPAPASSTPAAAAPPVAQAVAAAPLGAWHFRSPSGEQHGPLSELQLRASITGGRVTADTLLWREGWPEWRPASSVSEFLPTPLVAKLVPAPSSPPPLSSAVPAMETAPPVASIVEAAPTATLIQNEVSIQPTEVAATDSNALAASNYAYQRRKGKQKQVTLAVAMLIAVVVLAAVLYFVINMNPGSASDARAESATASASSPINSTPQKAIS